MEVGSNGNNTTPSISSLQTVLVSQEREILHLRKNLEEARLQIENLTDSQQQLMQERQLQIENLSHPAIKSHLGAKVNLTRLW